jgi:hypothetical protein
MIEFLSQPIVWKVVISYWVFSAAVGALETPNTTSPGWYKFVFRFAHALSGNLNRAAVTLKVPGAEPPTP